MASVLAACVVHALRDDDGTVGTTAIDKRPVDGPVRVRRIGLHADVQANRKDHGGEQQAVYAYAREDADFWAIELRRSLSPGWFGENLLVEGVDVSGARVGDRWQIGSGQHVVELEVTSARTPCQTFARWVGGADERGWVQRFAAAGRPGAYLRVVTPGILCAGDELVVQPTSVENVPTMARMLAERFPG